eukprot:3464565-Rhodomonas_salina.3
MQEARRAAAAVAASRRARDTVRTNFSSCRGEHISVCVASDGRAVVQQQEPHDEHRAKKPATTPSHQAPHDSSAPPGAGSAVAMVEAEMERAAAEMRFEDAIKLREALAVLRASPSSPASAPPPPPPPRSAEVAAAPAFAPASSAATARGAGGEEGGEVGGEAS